MSPDKISVLLGRPLSAIETTNFSTYLQLAQARVSDLLCSNICAENDTKTFELRDGYRTLNTPIFTEIQSITVDGNELTDTDYKVKQGASFNGDWFNVIVFDNLQNCKTIEVEADWGFLRTPVDVQLMIAEQFGLMSETIDADTISRKQVEDFSITYNGTKSSAFSNKFAPIISKYSTCVQGNIQSGNTYGRYYDYGRVYSL